MLRGLIADDERLTRRGLIAMLERNIREDAEWLEAGNGEEALKLVRRRPVDLVITDICMPLCNGLEFVEQLRQSQPNLTVIIISGYANFDYAKQAVRLGVRDYIMKPVDKEEFFGLVERCIAEIQKKRQDAEEESLRQAHTERVTDELQQESLRRVLEGNGDAFSLRTLSDAGMDMSAAGYCCASLEMLKDTAESRLRPSDERPRFKRFSDLWSYFDLRSETEVMLQQLNAESEGSSLTKEIIHYTIDHATEDIDLNHLASRFGKTPGYIGKLFRQGCQVGFNEFITGERIRLAKRLLRTPAFSVQQVGEKCGYLDAKYFSTTFRKVTGMSPKQYREQGCQG